MAQLMFPNTAYILPDAVLDHIRYSAMQLRHLTEAALPVYPETHKIIGCIHHCEQALVRGSLRTNLNP
jgi:hypothetical protein